MKWEYLVLKVKPGMLESDDPLQLGRNGGSVGGDNLNSALNQLGGEGWEGFSTAFDKGIIVQVLLKRQK